MPINKKKSEAMRESWARRKSAALNGKTIRLAAVVASVKHARKLVDAVGGDIDIAKQVVESVGVSD